MSHHEAHDDHGHDDTEGKRQYYPKGWYLPLVGLFVVAFVFAIGLGSLLAISGTDKWGKHEVCHIENCDGHCGMEHEKAECCKDGDHKECKDGDMHENAVAPHNNDSVNIAAAPADSAKADTAVKEMQIQDHK